MYLITAREPIIPWEIRGEMGLLKALWETIRKVLLKPDLFFDNLEVKKPFIEPFSFYFIVVTLATIFSRLIGLLLARLISPQNLFVNLSIKEILIIFACSFLCMSVAVGLLIFILSLAVHLFVWLFKGEKGFRGTFAVMAYSSAAYIITIIPLLGGMFGNAIVIIWALIIGIIGIQRIQRLTLKKATLVYLLAAILFSGIGFYFKSELLYLSNIPNLLHDNAYTQLQVILLHSSNPKKRAYAAYVLGEMAKKKTLEPLIRVLQDKDDFVRREGAIALGKIKDARAIPALVFILKDEDELIRFDAVNALVEIGKPSVEQLIAALNNEDEYVRSNAAVALGKLKDERAIPPLILALQHEAGRYQRSQAEIIRALAEIGEPAIGPLIASLEEKDGTDLFSVALALQKITGQDFGQVQINWQNWWEQKKKEK